MKRVIAIILIVTGSLLLLIGAGYFLLNQAVIKPNPAPLPNQISNLPLFVMTTGRQSISEVTRMHGKEFPLTSGAVGRYGADHQVTLWVAGTLVKPLATRIMVAMRDKIAEGNSPFTTVGERLDGKRTIHELDGLGQKHFYFQSGNLLIWLAADATLAEEVLRNVLIYYP